MAPSPENTRRLALRAVSVVGVLLFAVATTVVLAWPSRPERRVLWFPDAVGRREIAEWHYLPAKQSREAEIRALVEEMILGPVTLGAVPFIPRSTAIQMLLLDDRRTVYIDFDHSVLFGDGGLEDTSFQSVASRIERAVLHNFRSVDRVVITVNGQLPGRPRFSDAGR